VIYNDVNIKYSTTGIFYNSPVSKHFAEISEEDLKKTLLNLQELGYIVVSLTCGRIN